MAGQEFIKEMEDHLKNRMIPFWEGLRDDTCGGYYGYKGFDLVVDKRYEKGCILNSRILWFFSNAYRLFGDERLAGDARHAYEFMKNYCVDRDYGGVYWSVSYDGEVIDSTKHTYNQAFAIYALASYYDAVGSEEALALALQIQSVIEEKCTDEWGYLEAFNRQFEPEDNDKLSENGVMAEKTMNTLLHVMEAYTELYRVSRDGRTENRLRFILDLLADKLYNPDLKRQEVFFDKTWNSLIDLHSYGHDIETAWLTDRCLDVLGDEAYMAKLTPVTRALTGKVYEKAYREHSLLNEAERGVDDTTRVWWVQAEAVVGFYNGWQRQPEHTEYLEAAREIWSYICNHMIDPRPGSEWFWSLDSSHRPIEKPIVEPWKCP
ncbi:MAG TPA: N-acylglucosamine 2-epimerase, partial [Lachnospiraceae bacterium]|nr:N-acylglucosamine 2-epimerase [Lachnospiraceae bacterium]